MIDEESPSSLMDTLHLDFMQEQRPPLLALERINQRLRELLELILEGCE